MTCTDRLLNTLYDLSYGHELFQEVFLDSQFNYSVRHALRRELQGTRADAVILDVGAGPASFTRYIHSSNIIALDIPSVGSMGFTPEITRQLRRCGLNSIMASAEWLPLRGGVAEVIVCTEVIEHLRDDHLAAREMARVATTDCRILITTPNASRIPLEQGIREHVRHYTLEQLVDLLSQNGLEAVSSRKWLRMSTWRIFSLAPANFRADRRHLLFRLVLSSLVHVWMFILFHLAEPSLAKGDANLLIVAKPKSEPRRSAAKWSGGSMQDPLYDDWGPPKPKAG